MARLKQAKDEAEREVAQYRANMEAEYQKKVTEVKPNPVAFIIKIHFFICFFIVMIDKFWVVCSTTGGGNQC